MTLLQYLDLTSMAQDSKTCLGEDLHLDSTDYYPPAALCDFSGNSLPEAIYLHYHGTRSKLYSESVSCFNAVL